MWWKQNWSQSRSVNISNQIISYQFVGKGESWDFFIFNDTWDISWMSSAEGMEIKSTFPMSVTPVCPFMIPIQKCLHIATICPNSLISCKIVPSSKAAIFCFKLQLFLHFHQCMHAREQLHCRGTYLAHGIKPRKKYKKMNQCVLLAALCQKHCLVFWYKTLQK